MFTYVYNMYEYIYIYSCNRSYSFIPKTELLRSFNLVELNHTMSYLIILLVNLSISFSVSQSNAVS